MQLKEKDQLIKDIQTPNLYSIRSRYDLKERLLLQDGNLVIRNMRPKDLKPNSSPYDTLHIVTAGEKYRPDILANKYYGDPRFAWIILSANNMSDIFELEVGSEIIIPTSSSIFSSGGVLL